MTPQQKALAQLQQWGQNGYQGGGSSWGAVAAPTYTKKKTTGRGGMLSSLIAELGGAGGAAGGAALGASIGSVVPGLGTAIGGLIGAGIGGFAGGTAGQGVENKVRNDQNFFGKGGSAKQAFGEGALSGAFGAAGTGFRLARGLGAVGKEAGAGFGGRTIAGTKAIAGMPGETANATVNAALSGGKKGVNKLITGESGRLASGASRLESRALGFGQGEKVAGQVMKPKDIQDMFAVMKSEGIKSGHPDVVGKQVEARLSKVGEQINSTLQKANRPLTKQEVGFIQKGFAGEVRDNVALAGSPAAQREAAALTKAFGNIKSVEDIVKQRRNIQNSINFARSSGSKTPESEQILWSAQDWLNKLSGSISPELKALNQRYAGLAKLEDATLNASKGLTSQSRSALSGLTGSLKAGDTATAAKGAFGQAGRGLADILGSSKMQTAGNVAKGTAGLGLINQSLQAPQDVQQLDQSMGQDTLGAQQFGGQFGGQVDPMAQQPQQSPYPIEAMMYDIQRDPKHATQYQALYKTVSDAMGSQAGGGANISKVTAQQYGLAQSGAQALQQLAQAISQDPNVVTRTATPGRGLPGIGGFISNAAGTGSYDAIGYNIADTILRLRTGAQANESEVKKLQTQIMPRAGDSPQTIQTKLIQIQSIFDNVLNLAGSQPAATSQSDLSSMLAQGGF